MLGEMPGGIRATASAGQSRIWSGRTGAPARESGSEAACASESACASAPETACASESAPAAASESESAPAPAPAAASESAPAAAPCFTLGDLFARLLGRCHFGAVLGAVTDASRRRGRGGSAAPNP